MPVTGRLEAARRRRCPAWLWAGFVCALAPGAGAAERVLSLDLALRTSLANHPSIAVTLQAERASEARVGQAFAGYLPSVAYNLGYTRRTANCVSQPGSFSCDSLPNARAGFDTFNFFQAGVSIVQPLWDFGRTDHGHSAARVGVEAAREQGRATRYGLVQDVKLAYYNVLAQQELIKVAEENLAQQRKHLEQAEGLLAAGTKTRIDVAQSLSDVANAELALIRSRNNHQNAKIALLSTMGESQSGTDYTVEALFAPPLEEETLPTESVLQAAETGRADLRALLAQARQQDASILAARSNYWPALSLQFGPTFGGTSVGSLSTNFAATVTLSVPGSGFNPYYTYHQVAELHATARAARATASKLRNELRAEVQTARFALASAKQAIAASERALAAARERLELAEGRYAAGTGTMLELSDAQTALVQSRAARIQADYDISVARAQLTKALGRE